MAVLDDFEDLPILGLPIISAPAYYFIGNRLTFIICCILGYFSINLVFTGCGFLLVSVGLDVLEQFTTWKLFGIDFS